MPDQRYAFRIKLYSDDVDPQAVGERIDALIDEKKEHVTDEELVAEARHAASPLHACFTWNNGDAAHKQRRREARQLTKALHLEKGGTTTKTRAFVYVNHPEHGGKRVLINMRSAMGRQEFQVQVVERGMHALRRSLSYWSVAYGKNPQLAKLAKQVDKLRDKVMAEILAAI